MKVDSFLNVLEDILGIEFFAGVPDSLLKPLCNTLFNKYGTNGKHIIAANEGGATALAAGHYLATGKPALVYLQNSGLGNIINPVASLMNDRVYGIPCIFVVGWRGEIDIYDEPQHVFQGIITLDTLRLMEIEYLVLDKDTSDDEFREFVIKSKNLIDMGKSVAIVVKKAGLSSDEKLRLSSDKVLLRESCIEEILSFSGDDVIVSTTGKTSREVFEIRERLHQGHEKDFLTVGSMGHCSMIALGMAKANPNNKVWCIDGDGASIMHLGSLAVMANSGCDNVVHIVINNGAHESVGGLPVVSGDIRLCDIARSCGYGNCYEANSLDEVRKYGEMARKSKGLCFIEIMVKSGSRDDLGRPSNTPRENKLALMNYIKLRED